MFLTFLILRLFCERPRIGSEQIKAPFNLVKGSFIQMSHGRMTVRHCVLYYLP